MAHYKNSAVRSRACSRRYVDFRAFNRHNWTPCSSGARSLYSLTNFSALFSSMTSSPTSSDASRLCAHHRTCSFIPKRLYTIQVICCEVNNTCACNIFHEVSSSIHETVVVDTVVNAIHVAYFMNKQLPSSTKKFRPRWE